MKTLHLFGYFIAFNALTAVKITVYLITVLLATISFMISGRSDVTGWFSDKAITVYKSTLGHEEEVEYNFQKTPVQRDSNELADAIIEEGGFKTDVMMDRLGLSRKGVTAMSKMLQELKVVKKDKYNNNSLTRNDEMSDHQIVETVSSKLPSLA